MAKTEIALQCQQQAAGGQALAPDLDQTRRRLTALDPAAETFVFQTFDD